MQLRAIGQCQNGFNFAERISLFRNYLHYYYCYFAIHRMHFSFEQTSTNIQQCQFKQCNHPIQFNSIQSNPIQASSLFDSLLQTSYFTFTGSEIKNSRVSGRLSTKVDERHSFTHFCICTSRSFIADAFKCDPRICIFFAGNFTAFSSFESFPSIFL